MVKTAKATEKQMAYLHKIEKELCIEYEGDGSKEDVSDFISEYEQDFKESLSLLWRENRSAWLD